MLYQGVTRLVPRSEGGRAKIIEFSHVTKEFASPAGGLRIVDDITLSVHQGEIVTLLGPSGCGKSTLLNMSAGLMKPSLGRVCYAGEPVAGINNRVGYMTQQDHLLPWRTVAGNVSVPLEIRGLDRHSRNERVAELLELVGLEKFGDEYPTRISGGMRKRAALARVLAANPETLLMDEPFAALDAQMRITMQAELLRLSGRLGTSVLFVTHDVDEAVALADRCVVLGPRPTSVQQIVDIDIPRPRDLVGLRSDPRYQSYCAELWSVMARGFPNQAHGGRP